MKKKELKLHNPKRLPTIEYKKLKPLQDDLKDLPEENCVKLYNSLKRYGFRMPVFVWRDDTGEFWIMDAHQRQKVLRRMEERGWSIPRIPYVEIYARDRKEAAEMLLQINSRYGVYNPDTTFFDGFGIDLSFIDEIEIPELEPLLANELWKEKHVKRGKGFIAEDITWLQTEEEAMKVYNPELFEGKEKIIVAFSGGVDSTFALYWCKYNYPEKTIIAVFSDTGVEFPGMTAHIADVCDFLEIEYKIVKPEKDMWIEIRNRGRWPTPLIPWCREELVFAPINRYHAQYKPSEIICVDGSAGRQATRLSKKTKTSRPEHNSVMRKYDFYHPAFDVPRELIDSILKKAGVPLWPGYKKGFVRSACWMCPNQCGEQAYALSCNYPGLVEIIREWEQKLDEPLQSYNGRSIDMLIETGRKKVAEKKSSAL